MLINNNRSEPPEYCGIGGESLQLHLEESSSTRVTLPCNDDYYNISDGSFVASLAVVSYRQTIVSSNWQVDRLVSAWYAMLVGVNSTYNIGISYSIRSDT